MSVDRSMLVEKQEIKRLLQERSMCSGIRLPRDIEFSSEKGIMRVFVKNPVQNMQEDGAAFEGWILAMKRWLPELTEKVVLDFMVTHDLKRPHLGNSRYCHANRFLYRVNLFSEMFPDWFAVEDVVTSFPMGFPDWLRDEPTYLNHSLKPRRSVPETEKVERRIETWFVYEDGKPGLCALWDIEPTTLNNQLPVGVFRQCIKSNNAVFPRGASAVDIWGIAKDETTLHVIELKSGNNIKLGVISEILFYARLLFDTRVSTEGFIKLGRYGKAPLTPDWQLFSNGKFKHLHAHILAERYHPLFDSEVARLMAQGLSRCGINFDRACYNYQERTIKGLC